MCLTSPARSKDYLCQLLGGGGSLHWCCNKYTVYSGCMHGIICINLVLDNTYNEAFQLKRSTIVTSAFIFSSPLLLLLWMLSIT